ncbi:MAG: type II secretion system F family protein [Lachnospiraceae bacterium]|jgi:type IV pilus assembly protein PilC|nr:type II secretion system F family protein [Lachnospiraceae bacterium]
MPEYQYRIITPDGKEKKGTMEAKSVEQLTGTLKGQGNVIISVGEASAMSRDLNINLGAAVKARDFSIFCHQLVSILGAGVSIIHALEMMKDATENKTLKTALGGVHDDVSKGEAMALAMRKRKKVFPEMLCNMVEAGEASGSLEVAFTRMAVQFEKEDRLKKSIKKATIYPMVLVVLMLGMLFLMLMWVIPTFMGMFEDLDTELTGFTLVILNMSNFVSENWIFLIVGVIGAIIGIRVYSKTDGGKRFFGTLALKLPVLGPLQTKTACARLGRTLSTLLGAGIPLVDAVEITGRSMDNHHYKNAMIDTRDQIMRGRTLSQPLKSSGLFPVMVTHMVGIGEETGNIEDMLENIANYYEDDVQTATDAMMAMLEPAIIVVMAIAVGAMVIAILQPMMQLYEAIG